MTAMWEEELDSVEATPVPWSTSTILTIFFASSLVAALFFGLGFTFGPAQTARFAGSTPASGGVTSAQTSDALLQSGSRSSIANRNATQPYVAKSSPGKLKLQPVSAAETGRGSAPAARSPELLSGSHSAAVDKAAAAPSGNRYMVQIGAIGNRRDAQELVSRLRKQGFHARIYTGKRDKFLHVQLGPFTGTQQAQSVRRRVMAHGYHALLKPTS
jgi:cell division septation protein DedD